MGDFGNNQRVVSSVTAPIKLKLPHTLTSSEFYVYEVEFKRAKEKFEKSATCPEDFEIGDCVKVEGSRGQNIGFICNIEVQTSDDVPFFGPDGQESFKKIVGRAPEHEKKALMTKLRDEDRALHICNELATRRRLPILIVDAEFQFDRNKLTFSYVSDRRVDFRELVRDLFSLFKTRIWMQKLDSKGNPIHSTMSSNDPTSPALDTPQYFHQQELMMMKEQGLPDRNFEDFEDGPIHSTQKSKLTSQGSTSSDRSYADTSPPCRAIPSGPSSVASDVSFSDIPGPDDISQSSGFDTPFHSQRAVQLGEDRYHQYRPSPGAPRGYPSAEMNQGGRSHRTQPQASSRSSPPRGHSQSLHYESDLYGGMSKDFDYMAAMTNRMSRMDMAPYMSRGGGESTPPYRSQQPPQWSGTQRPHIYPHRVVHQPHHFQQSEYQYQQHFAPPPQSDMGRLRQHHYQQSSREGSVSSQSGLKYGLNESEERYGMSGMGWPVSSHVPNSAAPSWEPASSRSGQPTSRYTPQRQYPAAEDFEDGSADSY